MQVGLLVNRLRIAVWRALHRSRAHLVGRLNWNEQSRAPEAQQLLTTAKDVAAKYPEIEASFKATEGSPQAGDVDHVELVPSWHFDVCTSVLFD